MAKEKNVYKKGKSIYSTNKEIKKKGFLSKAKQKIKIALSNQSILEQRSEQDQSKINLKYYQNERKIYLKTGQTVRATQALRSIEDSKNAIDFWERGIKQQQKAIKKAKKA